MAKTRIETGTDGTWIFYDPDEGARASNLVLFVHGYSGDADGTWLRFPNLMLQADQGFFERFDIASFGYGSSLLVNREDVESLTGRLRTFLLAYGNRAENVFIICHSLGGLLARRLLVDCHGQPRYQQLLGRVKQVHLIGVPHLGAVPAKGALVAILRPFNRLAVDIRKDSPVLADTLTRWLAIVDAAGQRGESLPQLFNYVGSRDWVAPMSAVSDGSLEAMEVVEIVAGDHITIAKPVTAQNEAYILITRAIKDWVREHGGGGAAPGGKRATPGGGGRAANIRAQRDIVAGMVANEVHIHLPAAPTQPPADGAPFSALDASAPRSFYRHPSADALRLALASAFGPRRVGVVEVLCAQAGMDTNDVDWQGSANEIWRQVLLQAHDSALLDALMGLILREDRIRAHHERMRGLWETLRVELAEAALLGPAAASKPPSAAPPPAGGSSRPA